MQTSSTYDSVQMDATQQPTEENARPSCSPEQLNDTDYITDRAMAPPDNAILSPQDLVPHDKDSFGRSAHHSTQPLPSPPTSPDKDSSIRSAHHSMKPLPSLPTSPESIVATPQPDVYVFDSSAVHTSPKIRPRSKTLPPLPSFATSHVTSAIGMCCSYPVHCTCS